MQRWKNVWAGGPVEKENLIKLKQEGTLVKLPEKSWNQRLWRACWDLDFPRTQVWGRCRRGSRGQSGWDAGSGAGWAGRTQLLPLTALQPGASDRPSPSRHAIMHSAELRPVPPAPHATQSIAVTPVSTGRRLKHGKHTAASNPHWWKTSWSFQFRSQKRRRRSTRNWGQVWNCATTLGGKRALLKV